MCVTDPIGRRVRYGYDEGGRLVSVLDAVGCEVKYGYSGHLLTAIEKPDGTALRYEYVSRNGSPALSATIDEEGATERFEYGTECTVHIDPSGTRETHYFDSRRFETRVEHSDGTARSMEYDEGGYLVKETDELGMTTGYERDGRGNAIRTHFPDGSVRTARYNRWNLPVEEVDERGQCIQYAYDERGNLVSIDYPDGSRKGYSYDAYGNCATATDERGNTHRCAYGPFGYLSRVTTPSGGVIEYRHDAVGNLLSVTDELGFRREYTYNDDNQLIEVVDADGNREHLRYDARKNLVERIDALGNKRDYVYDRRHLCVGIVGPEGTRKEFRYRRDRRVAEVSEDGRTHTIYGYDDRGRLTSIEGPVAGAVRIFEYDASGRLVGATDPNGNVVRLRRDPLGRIIAEVDPTGTSREYRYDAVGNLISVTNRVGGVTEYSYDERSRLIEERNPLGNTKHYEYDRAGNLVSFINENGETTRYGYDEENRLETVVDPCGATRRYSYSPRGELSAYVDPAGARWSYAYDRNGRIVSVTGPLGGRRTVAYDAVGNPTLLGDPNGHTIRLRYDRAGRLVEQTDPRGASTSYTYGLLDKIKTITDPRGNSWSYGYDSAGRLISRTTPLGEKWSFHYDYNGNLVSSSDPEGGDTRYEYDCLDRLIARTDATGSLVSWSYDPLGNVLTEVDPLGHAYSWRYDTLSRLIGETNRNGAACSYSYDPSGNLVGKRDFNKVDTEYRYDSAGRLLSVRAPECNSSFAYDANGNVITASSLSGSYHFEYDSLSRLRSVERDDAAERTEYRYDSAGNCVEAGTPGDGYRVRFTYGAANELLSVEDSAGGITRFQYDEAGNKTLVRKPNGVAESTTYDLVGRPTSLVVRSGISSASGAPIWGRAFLYDRAGRRTYSVSTGGEITRNRYDAAGRIVSSSFPPTDSARAALSETAASLGCPSRLASFAGVGSTPAETKTESEYLEITSDDAAAIRNLIEKTLPLSRGAFNLRTETITVLYEYDAAGNRVAQTGPWGRIEYSYGLDHELLAAGKRRFDYDRGGRLVRETLGEESVEYRYTADNRVSRVVFHGRTLVHGEGLEAIVPDEVNYTYDPFGRRTSRRARWKTLPAHLPPGQTEPTPQETAPAATLEQYQYDGHSLRFGSLFSVGLSINSDGKEPSHSPGGSRYRYLPPDTSSRLPGSSANTIIYSDGKLLESISEGVPTYYSVDPLGSVVAETGPLGEVERLISYGPFGDSECSDSMEHATFGFVGKCIDPLTKLYDYGMRDYSPALGRWTTPDPIKSGTNWYVYAENDPINLVDPIGLLLESVSLTYYQDWNPRTNTAESYAEEPLGTVPKKASAEVQNDPETIGKYGCLLTAATRVANSINGNESITPSDANVVANKKGYYTAAQNGQVDELTEKSTAHLVESLTGTDVAYETYYSTKVDLKSKVAELNADTVKHYVIGQVVVGEGDSSYNHYLNVQALDKNGLVVVGDTSSKDRVYLDKNQESFGALTVITPKSK